jgi:DNA-binding LytR/AlgR family response regulator
LIVAYSVPFTFYTVWKSRVQGNSNFSDKSDLLKPNSHLKSLLVMDNNERIVISTADILYFSANSPYINIHHKQKRYLHNETLKSLSQRLDNELFVRVHKSVIVNIKNVQSYKSRLNGDYDLTMADGKEVRLSRNYASIFKQKFENAHQDTTK